MAAPDPHHHHTPPRHRASLLMQPAWLRVAAALGAVAGLWLAVAWALGGAA